MATLTTQQKAAISERLTTMVSSVNYTKPQVFAAIQAIEDWFEANQSELNTVINAATTPLVMSVAQKKALVALWLLQKARTDGAS